MIAPSPMVIHNSWVGCGLAVPRLGAPLLPSARWACHSDACSAVSLCCVVAAPFCSQAECRLPAFFCASQLLCVCAMYVLLPPAWQLSVCSLPLLVICAPTSVHLHVIPPLHSGWWFDSWSPPPSPPGLGVLAFCCLAAALVPSTLCCGPFVV